MLEMRGRDWLDLIGVVLLVLTLTMCNVHVSNEGERLPRTNTCSSASLETSIVVLTQWQIRCQMEEIVQG